MAEAVAVISLLSSIVQLVDFGTKLVERLDEFTSAVEDVPASFRSIKSQLPLAFVTLQRVEVQARSGRISDADAQALRPVVDSSLDETKQLTTFLDSAAPVGTYSALQRRIQAVKSLKYDKKVQKCVERLQANIQVLIFHQTTNHSDVVEHIREVLSKLTVSLPPPPSNFSFGLHLSHAPQVADGFFVGRQAEVIQLEQWLTPQSTAPIQRVAAIVGLGGLGKTQLSLTFAKQYHGKFSLVFWLNAKDELSLKQDFLRLSQTIGLDQGSGSNVPVDEDLVVQQVLRWLSLQKNDRWLLIFDNYDDPRLPGVKSLTGYDIRLYFPSRSQGSILITTRSRRLTFARQLKLAKLEDLHESIEILSSRSGRDLIKDPAAASLARRLDGLPLALATAGSYLGQSTESVTEYLHAYEECWDELNDTSDELVEYEDRTLFSTWNLSLAQVRAQQPEAAELLRLLGYFDNEGIDYNLLKPAKESGFEWLSSLTAYQRQFNRAMARLHDYSLVEIFENRYYLHTCVHDWTMQALNRDINAEYFWLAVLCIASNVKYVSEREYWKTNQKLVQHAIRLEHHYFQDILDKDDLNTSQCDDLDSLGTLWLTQGQLQRSKRMYRRALAGREKALGPDHTSTLDTVHSLGVLNSDQGKLAEAEVMYQRALAGCEKALGPDHTSTLSTVHNLSNLYRGQGKLAEAEEMYQRALAGYEKALGPDHTWTLSTVNNLGSLYRDQGKLAEAEEMYQRALAGYEKALGPDHTSTLSTVHNLSNLYRGQGKLAEAEEMYQHALAGYEKALGPDHTSTLSTVNNLGNLYSDQGKLAEAEEMYQRALAGKEKALGPDHTLTLSTVNNLGNLYSEQGKLAEAEEMYQRALAGKEKALGPDHTSALDTVYNLGGLYRGQGKLAEAEVMYQRALAGYEKALGPDHTSTLDTVHNLGGLYSDQGKLAEAEVMYQRVLAGYEKALGPDHTSTLSTVNNLGGLYRDQGKLAEAEEMYQRALAGYEKALGPDHTSTLDTVHNLGGLYRGQGKLAEAEEMYQRALAGYEKALGPDHTSTLSTVHNLSNLYRGQGKLAEAEEMYQRALAGYEKALGPDHTSTLRTFHNLDNLYSAHRSLAEYVKLAFIWRNKFARLFDGLGRMLIKHSDESNASIAFQQKIQYENGIMVHKGIWCDGCGLPITCAMRRFVCRDCPDGDICGECFTEHSTGVREVSTCSNHSFLEIASLTPVGSGQDSITLEAYQISWLQDLMVKYPEKIA